MSNILIASQGNYHYVKGGFQYSAAVKADEGYQIVRVQFNNLIPLAVGFERIRQHLLSQGRPMSALCACELRSPKPMVEADFINFNREYVKPLHAWGVAKDEINPVARCNLVPVNQAPEAPSFYAFSYTMPIEGKLQSHDFVTSGAAECFDRPNYKESIVRLGDTTADAMVEKLRFAVADLDARFNIMQSSWEQASSVNLYTAHPFNMDMVDIFNHKQANKTGVCWHQVRPPVKDLEIEIDAKRVSQQLFID